MEADPATVLEWLQMDSSETRELQLMALEQLCSDVLFSDNVDVFFERYQPFEFLPALCKIFLDETVPDSVLEADARAITYYLDLSNECSRRVVQVSGALKAISSRLEVVDMSTDKGNELGQQIIKLLQIISIRESTAIYESGGLTNILNFAYNYSSNIHNDTLLSAMESSAKLCNKCSPTDDDLPIWVNRLSSFLDYETNSVADVALKCLSNLVERFNRQGFEPTKIASDELLNQIMIKFKKAAGLNLNDNSILESTSDNQFSATQVENLSNLILAFCRGSQELMARFLGTEDLCSTLADMISYQSDLMVGDFFPRLVETLLMLLFNGHQNSPVKKIPLEKSESSNNANGSNWRKDEIIKSIHHAIRCEDTESFIEIFEKGQLNIDYSDEMGQTLLNWACAFGTREMVEYLCYNGADVNKGSRSSSLHYAACFGRPEIVRALLEFDANPNLQDDEGKLPIDKARDKASNNVQSIASSVVSSSGAASNLESVTNHQEVIQILSVADCYRTETAGNKPGDDSDEEPEIFEGDTSEDTRSTLLSSEKVSKESVKKSHVSIMDSEVQMMFLKKLMPVVLGILKDTLNSNVKRNSLSLLKKMTQFASEDLLKTISAIKTNNVLFSYSITQVVFSILTDNEDENILLSLEMSKDLLTKCPNKYINSFVRVGLIPRIQHVIDMTYPAFKALQAEGGQCLIDFQEPIQSTSHDSIRELSNPTSFIQSIGPYVWNDWNIIGSKRYLYLYNTGVLIAYNFDTNKCRTICADNIASNALDHFELRELQDSMLREGSAKIRYLFPSQSTSGNNVPSKIICPSIEAFLEKETGSKNSTGTNKSELTKTTGLIEENDKNFCHIKINNTTNSQKENGEVTIKLYSNKSCFLSKNDESDEIYSPRDIDFGSIPIKRIRPKFWNVIIQKFGDDIKLSNRNPKLNNNIHKRMVGLGAHQDFIRSKIYQIAVKINEKINKKQRNSKEISGSINKTRKSKFYSEPIESISNDQDEDLAESILDNIKRLAMELTNHQNKSSVLSIKPIISELENLLKDEMSMTAHELIISGLLSAIYHNQNESVRYKLLMNDGLVSKCVEALEQIEQLPTYSYLPQRQTTNGSTPVISNSHPISRPIKLQMYQLDKSDLTVYNATNHVLRVKPLVTISQLHAFLLENILRKWYDYPRSCLHFEVDKNLDSIGLFEYLGSNGKTLSLSEWENPFSKQLIRVIISDGVKGPTAGGCKDLIANYNESGNISHFIRQWSTSNHVNSWVAIDLGVYFCLKKYKFRIPLYNSDLGPVSWNLCGSKDGSVWIPLDKQTSVEEGNDRKTSEDNSSNDKQKLKKENANVRTVTIEQNSIRDFNGYRYIRIMQDKSGNKNGTHEFSLCGLELYGTIKSIVSDEEKWKDGEKWRQETLERTKREKESELRRTLRNITIGTRVCRGPNWKWGNQNGGFKVKGTVISELKQGWVDVKWDNGHANTYRMGKFQNFDLRLTDDEDIPVMDSSKNETYSGNLEKTSIDNHLSELCQGESKNESQKPKDLNKDLESNDENFAQPEGGKAFLDIVSSYGLENVETEYAIEEQTRDVILERNLMELWDASNVTTEESDLLIDAETSFDVPADAANVVSGTISESEQFDDDDEDDEDDDDEDDDDHDEDNEVEVTETNAKEKDDNVKGGVVEQGECGGDMADVQKNQPREISTDEEAEQDDGNDDDDDGERDLNSFSPDNDPGEMQHSFFLNILRLSSTDDVSQQLQNLLGGGNSPGENSLKRLLSSSHPSTTTTRTNTSATIGTGIAQRKRQPMRRNQLPANSGKIENNRWREEKMMSQQNSPLDAVLLGRHFINRNENGDDDDDDDMEFNEIDEDNRDLSMFLGGLMGRKLGVTKTDQMRSYKMAALAALASKTHASKKEKPKTIDNSNLKDLDDCILDKAPSGMIEPFDPRPGKINKPLTKTFSAKPEQDSKVYTNTKIYLCLRLKLPTESNLASTSMAIASNSVSCVSNDYAPSVSSISSRSSVSSSRSSSTIANDDDCGSFNSNIKKNTEPVNHNQSCEEYDRYCEVWLDNPTDCIFKYARKLMSHYRFVQTKLSASQSKSIDTQNKSSQSETTSKSAPNTHQSNVAGSDIQFRLCYTVKPPPGNIPFNTVVEYPGGFNYNYSNKKCMLDDEDFRIFSEYDLLRHQSDSERQAMEQLIRMLCLLQHHIEKEQEKFDEEEDNKDQKHKDVVKAINSVSSLSDVRSSLTKPSYITSLSKKLTKKMQQQLRDPLSVASNSFPDWCYSLATKCRLLLSIDSAILPLFRVTAFGAARAITWLQANRHSLNNEERGAGRSSGAPTNINGASGTSHLSQSSNNYYLSTQDYLGWRLQKEVSCVSRNPSSQFWIDACQLMKLHATRKTELEVMFSGEEGTGLGPTLDFFQQLSLEFTKPSRTMWHNPNMTNDDTISADIPLHPHAGLFPCPMSPGHARKLGVLDNFRTLGIVIAKCLQDARRMDLRLSHPLLKLICEWPHNEEVKTKRSLLLDDFCKIYPEIGQYLQKMQTFVEVRNQLLSENNNNCTKIVSEKLKEKCSEILGVSELSELNIGMDFTANSQQLRPIILRDVYKWEETYYFDDNEDDDEALSTVDLISEDTIEIYLERLLDFTLFKGIRAQVQAMMDGMGQVFRVSSLQLLGPLEFSRLLCGDEQGIVNWTMEELRLYIEPGRGYASTSTIGTSTNRPAFQWLLETLLEMDIEERRMFLMFSTGSSTLPPGGLKSLQPRIVVVKRENDIGNENVDGMYPSVNTCLHYLKLPEYSSKSLLRDRLTDAAKETGFHLN